MAIANGYLTLVEIKSHLHIGDTQDDAALELAVEAASRAIDDYCGRRFWLDSTDKTRYYDSPSGGTLWIDDLTTLTSLKTDAGNDGVYENTWATTDYLLEPVNAAADGRPYTHVVLRSGGAFGWPSYARSIEIVGRFGWPAVPAQVKEACAIQASRLFHSKDGGGGFSDFGQQGGGLGPVGSHKRYTDLLDPFRVPVVA